MVRAGAPVTGLKKTAVRARTNIALPAVMARRFWNQNGARGRPFTGRPFCCRNMLSEHVVGTCCRNMLSEHVVGTCCQNMLSACAAHAMARTFWSQGGARGGPVTGTEQRQSVHESCCPHALPNDMARAFWSQDGARGRPRHMFRTAVVRARNM